MSYVVLESGKKHLMKASDVIMCESHGVRVVFGQMSWLSQTAFMSGLDIDGLECLLVHEYNGEAEKLPKKQ